jgi:peptide/nickel transport system permease protein
VSGEIYYDNVNLTELSYKEIREYRGKKIGMIFQEPSRSFDPLQNMASVFYETIKNSNPKISKAEALKIAEELLEETGITNAKERLSNFPHQFSGGQLQRISIALSLAQGCELLIADEPTTALDVTIQNQIVQLLKKLQQEKNLSIIFISHNIDLVAEISDNIIVMYGGLIMEEGKTKSVLENPQHPYTQGLLKASPKFGSHYTNEKLFSIPGKVIEPTIQIEGCPFAPRCNSENKSVECESKNFVKKVCYGK